MMIMKTSLKYQMNFKINIQSNQTEKDRIYRIYNVLINTSHVWRTIKVKIKKIKMSQNE
jgi:hypothetical protein